MWMWGIRELADYFGCEPTPEAVLEARNSRDLQTMPMTCGREQNSEMLMIDYYGFGGAMNYTPEEMASTFNQKIEKLLRLETFAQDKIMRKRHLQRLCRCL